MPFLGAFREDREMYRVMPENPEKGQKLRSPVGF